LLFLIKGERERERKYATKKIGYIRLTVFLLETMKNVRAVE
jgi:hypothetical protein